MNKFLILVCLFIVGVSCSSSKNDKKEVQAEAKTVKAETDPKSQYTRAISMIEHTPDLKEDQKEKLIQVVNNYAMKNMEIRMQQSQYRAVLVNEMLNSGTKKNSKVNVAKKKLEELDKESSKNLGKFVRDFKYHSGNLDPNTYQPVMSDMMRL